MIDVFSERSVINKQYFNNFKLGVVGRLTTGISHLTEIDGVKWEEPFRTYQELYDLNNRYDADEIRNLTWMYKQYKGLYFHLKTKHIKPNKLNELSKSIKTQYVIKETVPLWAIFSLIEAWGLGVLVALSL